MINNLSFRAVFSEVVKLFFRTCYLFTPFFVGALLFAYMQNKMPLIPSVVMLLIGSVVFFYIQTIALSRLYNNEKKFVPTVNLFLKVWAGRALSGVVILSPPILWMGIVTILFSMESLIIMIPTGILTVYLTVMYFLRIVFPMYLVPFFIFEGDSPLDAISNTYNLCRTKGKKILNLLISWVFFSGLVVLALLFLSVGIFYKGRGDLYFINMKNVIEYLLVFFYIPAVLHKQLIEDSH